MIAEHGTSPHLKIITIWLQILENLHIFTKNQNQFFKKETGNLVLLDPQPDVNSVVILSRYHSKHRKDKKFQRRVSCFQNVPKRNDLHMMCLFKYIGNYPGEQIHGNSKRTNQPYIRTTLAQKSAILEGIKLGKKTISNCQRSGEN